ncbi:MAG: hypothetical protein H6704_10200 [Myxococcales bacterium]|nr:hypothetical protein [Myxococcales bacterium]
MAPTQPVAARPAPDAGAPPARPARPTVKLELLDEGGGARPFEVGRPATPPKPPPPGEKPSIELLE